MKIRTLVEGVRISSLLTVLLTPTFPVHGQVISRVSVASDGTQANSSSNPGVSISADGRFIAFRSNASNLVPTDTNGVADIFVHDRDTGETTLVSVASNGNQGSQESLGPSLSGDGRLVGFVSWSPDLVPGDNNGAPDVFVHDRVTGETELVSKSTSGTFGNDWSEALAFSTDGIYVAFLSDSTNLVPGDTNSRKDVFVHNLVTRVTTRVSVASDGSQAQGGVDPFAPSISANGHYVAFASPSTLVAGDTNGTSDIFVHERPTGQTTLASVSTDGAVSNDSNAFPSISDDGLYVGFSSYASNLVPNDTNGRGDVFVHDRATGVTSRVSVTGAGKQANSSSTYPSLSSDGRLVGFVSSASNLVPGDNNSETDIFIRDRAASRTIRISVSQRGEEADGDSFGPVDLSAVGLSATFNSRAPNLVPGDSNNFMDVFLAQLLIFTDGFESGETSAWSSTVQ